MTMEDVNNVLYSNSPTFNDINDSKYQLFNIQSENLSYKLLSNFTKLSNNINTEYISIKNNISNKKDNRNKYSGSSRDVIISHEQKLQDLDYKMQKMLSEIYELKTLMNQHIEQIRPQIVHNKSNEYKEKREFLMQVNKFKDIVHKKSNKVVTYLQKMKNTVSIQANKFQSYVNHMTEDVKVVQKVKKQLGNVLNNAHNISRKVHLHAQSFENTVHQESHQLKEQLQEKIKNAVPIIEAIQSNTKKFANNAHKVVSKFRKKFTNTVKSMYRDITMAQKDTNKQYNVYNYIDIPEHYLSQQYNFDDIYYNYVTTPQYNGPQEYYNYIDTTEHDRSKQYNYDNVNNLQTHNHVNLNQYNYDNVNNLQTHNHVDLNTRSSSVNALKKLEKSYFSTIKTLPTYSIINPISKATKEPRLQEIVFYNIDAKIDSKFMPQSKNTHNSSMNNINRENKQTNKINYGYIKDLDISVDNKTISSKNYKLFDIAVQSPPSMSQFSSVNSSGTDFSIKNKKLTLKADDKVPNTEIQNPPPLILQFSSLNSSVTDFGTDNNKPMSSKNYKLFDVAVQSPPPMSQFLSPNNLLSTSGIKDNVDMKTKQYKNTSTTHIKPDFHKYIIVDNTKLGTNYPKNNTYSRSKSNKVLNTKKNIFI